MDRCAGFPLPSFPPTQQRGWAEAGPGLHDPPRLRVLPPGQSSRYHLCDGRGAAGRRRLLLLGPQSSPRSGAELFLGPVLPPRPEPRADPGAPPPELRVAGE